jgi:hypothetical protein
LRAWSEETRFWRRRFRRQKERGYVQEDVVQDQHPQEEPLRIRRDSDEAMMLEDWMCAGAPSVR